MAPLVCFFIVTGIAELARHSGNFNYLATFSDSVRVGLAATFLLTGLARFNNLKKDLIQWCQTACPTRHWQYL
jgi:hypothetical protein